MFLWNQTHFRRDRLVSEHYKFSQTFPLTPNAKLKLSNLKSNISSFLSFNHNKKQLGRLICSRAPDRLNHETLLFFLFSRNTINKNNNLYMSLNRNLSTIILFLLLFHEINKYINNSLEPEQIYTPYKCALRALYVSSRKTFPPWQIPTCNIF